MRKVAAFVVTVSLIILGQIFAALLLAVIVACSIIVQSYLWWKTRKLRKLMRNRPTGSVKFESRDFSSETFKGEVIEGEVIREVVTRIEK